MKCGLFRALRLLSHTRGKKTMKTICTSAGGQRDVGNARNPFFSAFRKV